MTSAMASVLHQIHSNPAARRRAYHREYKRRYYIEHREQRREYRRRYRAKNREQQRNTRPPNNINHQGATA